MAKAKSTKYVYTWGNKKADGDGSMKPLLGGKGANLAEMTRIGLPVPPGFTITTEVCTYYYDNKKTYPEVLEAQAKAPVGTTRNRCSGSTGRQITGIFSQKMQSVGTVSGLKEVLQRRAL